jgi:hypothetical protein
LDARPIFSGFIAQSTKIPTPNPFSDRLQHQQQPVTYPLSEISQADNKTLANPFSKIELERIYNIQLL